MSANRWALFFLIGLAACATGSRPAFSACAGVGESGARSLKFPPDLETRKSLALSIHLGLNPPSFPAEQIRKQPAPCRRASFHAGEADFTLFGTDAGLPPRYAVSTRDDRIAYVALLPLPKPAAAAWKENPGAPKYSFPHQDFMYVLSLTNGGQRLIYRFYSVLPKDDRLMADMCAALTGEDPVIGIYDSLSGRSDLRSLGLASEALHSSRCRANIS